MYSANVLCSEMEYQLSSQPFFLGAPIINCNNYAARIMTEKSHVSPDNRKTQCPFHFLFSFPCGSQFLG